MARKKVRKAGGRAQAQRQQVHRQQMQRQQMQRQQMSGEQLERQQIERERAKRQQEGQRREQLLMQQRREMQQRQEMLRQQQMYGAPVQEEGKRKKKARRFYDYDLLVVIIFLTVFGLIMIYSSSAYNAQVSRQPSNYYMVRQGQIAVAGFILMLIISKIDYHFFAKITVPAVVVSYICEILVTFTPLGIAVNGKKRWLGTRSLRFQPAELVKIVVILLLAVLITRLGKQINDRGPHRTSGTPRHHEQLKLRYHHLRNRFRHDVYRVQEKMAVYCDGGAWNHCHRLRAACGHRPREGGNPPFLPAEPNPGVEKPGGVSEVRWISGPSGTVRYRFRRPSRKGTGTEYPEVKLPSGAAERYDLRGDL